MKTFQFFCPKSWVNPSEKFDFWDLKNDYFYDIKKLCFFQNIIQHYFYPYLKPKLDKEKLKCLTKTMG